MNVFGMKFVCVERKKLRYPTEGLLNNGVLVCQLFLYVTMLHFVIISCQLSAQLWAVWGERQCATDPNAPYLGVLELFPRLLHGGLNDIGLEWGPETSALSLPVLDNPEKLSVTYTPPGNLTRPHTDGFGYWLRIVHWKGTKIWVLWPCTPHNLCHVKGDIAARKENDCRLSYYIRNLEGMETYVVQTNHGNPIAFELPPSTIHACISVDMSSHASLAVWRKEGLKAAQICNHFMMDCWKNWGKHKTSLTGQSMVENEVQARLDTIVKDGEERWDGLSIAYFGDWKKEWMAREEKGWNDLARSLETQSECKRKIRNWVKEVMGFIKKNIPASE